MIEILTVGPWNAQLLWVGWCPPWTLKEGWNLEYFWKGRWKNNEDGKCDVPGICGEKRRRMIKVCWPKICACLPLQTPLHVPSWSLPHLGTVCQLLKQGKLSPVSACVMSFALCLEPSLPSLPLSLKYHLPLDWETCTNGAHLTLSSRCYSHEGSLPWITQMNYSICTHPDTLIGSRFHWI